MQSFNTILLLNTLRGLLEELEQDGRLESKDAGLEQLRHAIRQQIAFLLETGRSEHFEPEIRSAA